MTIEVRQCTLEELSLLQKISIETFRDTFQDQNTTEDLQNYLAKAYNIKQLKTELMNIDSEFYFLYSQNELAGYLKININEAQSEVLDKDALEVERIYIRAPFKKKGLGKILIQKATDRAQKYHRDKIWLGVWEHNHAAINFYKKLGFVQTGAHSFFMGDDEQIDFILTKELTNTKEWSL
ncbi:GNAT family N-acetyltransferase [Desemzia sp. RIT804]|uniref:GNAT family N-acetyltransferase n=1 Tax=Desemzia sp. RIT 804 TaxID=2810209 RepID=UPI001951E727|nr:GNAT family N-acetyltransferase [Desemzia sp. RIT 804]MBM6614842.1 GNAT family N-acetyltransferase [Desemzia sp. RIT 804]